MAVSKSSRRPTACCRSRPRAIINHGPRSLAAESPAPPEVPFYPPPVIIAPQNGGSGMPQNFVPRHPKPQHASAVDDPNKTNANKKQIHRRE